MTQSWFHAIGQGLQELFYPTLCPVCSHPTQREHLVCRQCLQILPRTEHQHLRENAIELLFFGINRPLRRVRFIRGGAWLKYNDSVATLIHCMKFYEHPEVATYLAGQAAKEWQQSLFFEGIDYLVPIPLHPHRLRERGFNQSWYICQGLQQILGIPIDDKHLVRIKDTAHQSLSTDAERERNIQDAFAVHHPEDWHGKHILLVDDVITTGATIRECIKTLTPIRTCQMSVFALAIARW